MNFLELTQKRCSIRQYADKPVEAEKINYLLEAARMAPSAVNRQPWFFVLVQSEEKREQLQACYAREWFRQAPAYIIVCGDHQPSWKRPDGKDHMDIDAAIAAEHICLAAAEQGIGSCWVCNFDVERCKREFRLPEEVEPVVLIPHGYPANPDAFGQPKNRKPIEEITKRESF